MEPADDEVDMEQVGEGMVAGRCCCWLLWCSLEADETPDELALEADDETNDEMEEPGDEAAEW